jgi:pyrimidine operon attenuation protein / uracil phosphoribosyltransferase
MSKTTILNHTEIAHKVRRIAYQIYESNVNESEVVVAGIADNGYILAQKITLELQKISPIKIILCKVKMDKSNVFEPVTTSLEANDYLGKSLILVDDVLHTGSVLMYAVKHFLNVPLKQIKTAVLVDRNHKKFPIKVDFKGISLSTTFQNRVEVVFLNEKDEAYLI